MFLEALTATISTTPSRSPQVVSIKAGMALDDRAVSESSQPFLHAPVRPPRYLILACFHAFHINAHIAIDNKSKLGASAGKVGCLRARNKRLCWEHPVFTHLPPNFWRSISECICSDLSGNSYPPEGFGRTGTRKGTPQKSSSAVVKP